MTDFHKTCETHLDSPFLTQMWGVGELGSELPEEI
jgi:hypothetical protein